MQECSEKAAEHECDEPRQGVVAIRLNLFRNGAVGFIEWLGVWWRLHKGVAVGANENDKNRNKYADLEKSANRRRGAL